MTSGQSTSTPRRRRGALLPTLIILVLAVIAFVFFANVYTEVLWFSQLGFDGIFWRQNIAKGSIFIAAFLLMAAVVYLSIQLAYRARPVYAPENPVQENLNRYQAQLEPVRKVVMIGVPLVFGLFAGAAALGQWQKVMLFIFQSPFGQNDPQFGMDIAFYTNTLPFLGFLSGLLISVVLISGIAALLTHYLYGAIRLQERGLFTSRAAQIQLSIMAGIFLILLGANFWLDRFSTLQNNTGLRSGAMYTDINAVIPTKAILAIAAGIVAILFIVAAVIGRWRLPVIGTAMLIITGIVAGGIYPWAVQQFQVKPSEATVETQYIQRNIDMTRSAYGINDVEVIPYKATTTAAPGALRQDATTTANIRLLDPNLMSQTFAQLEQYRPYYGFQKTLNVDRYMVDGKIQDTVIALRELNPAGIPAAQQSWYNQKLVYTHGYGVVAAYGNTATADGKPVFMQSGVPTTGKLGDDSSYQPRIYFGQNTTDYSIVGAPEGAPSVELDRPQGGDTASDSKNTFNGNGGPDVGNWFNKLAYSIKFQSTDLLLSSGVNEKSQILYDRTPVQRVQKVAPYLTIDGNPYPAIIDGKVKWIVDGYTTSSAYPYSQQQPLDSATTDSLTTRSGTSALSGSINYIRNSVKATVDAYDGSVNLYAWDDKDPILKAWQNIFPSTVKPISEMSGDLLSHIRYPEDLFKVQRELLGRYHVTNAAEFYNNTDAWSVPNDPTAGDNTKQPPYYMSLQMPGQSAPAFSLTSNFIPQSVQGTDSRNVLYGYLAADADAGSTDGVKADSYGKLRLLSLPTDTLVPGPGQVYNRFVSDPTISNALNILKLGQSTLKNGNLLTLPVGGGLLYVQPVYVQSSTGESSYPTLQRVLVAFGDKIAFAPTLDAALDQLFGGDSGASAGDKDKGTTTTAPPGSSGGTGTGENPDAKAALNKALQDANQALKDGQDALSKSDFAAYGVAQKKLNDAIAAALAAEGKLGASAAPAPAPSSSPSPSGQSSGAPTAGSSEVSDSASAPPTP